MGADYEAEVRQTILDDLPSSGKEPQ